MCKYNKKLSQGVYIQGILTSDHAGRLFEQIELQGVIIAILWYKWVQGKSLTQRTRMSGFQTER